MKEWFISFFYFSKKERLGALIMLIIISCIWLLPFLFRNNKPDIELIDLAGQSGEQSKTNVEEQSAVSVKPNVFYFDPNTLTDSGWNKLGIPYKVVKTIKNYLSKGGRFRAPDDIRHIYGLSEYDADRLMPYIQIPKNQGNKKSIWRNNGSFQEYRNTNKKIELQQSVDKKSDKRNWNIKPVELNTADTSALIDLPGIGSKLAKRIVEFRDLAGGFYSLSQLSDIYGLSDSTFMKLQKYVTVNGNVRKLMINYISADSLTRHPYINKIQAKTIIRFRQMHGPFENIEMMQSIHNIDSSTLMKLQPYLSFENSQKN